MQTGTIREDELMQDGSLWVTYRIRRHFHDMAMKKEFPDLIEGRGRTLEFTEPHDSPEETSQ